MNTAKKLVIYHGGCHDGFCAAWLFWKAYPDAEFVAANYGEPPPDVTGSDVYIVDLSYKRDVMSRIIASANKVCVLDHHKTAQAELQCFQSCPKENFTSLKRSFTSANDKVYIHFDMEKSGGRLAFDFLNNHILGLWQAPWLVDYTEDRDLWRWKLVHSREVNAALRSYPMTFDTWDMLGTDCEARDLIPEGEAILRAEAKIVESAVRHAWEIELDGYKVPCVNATTLISEIGEQLAKDKPFSATFFVKEKQRIWSLRSSEGGVDVSEIAKRRGGGGHKRAAGFEEEMEPHA